jgi:hypothetical protein
VRTGDVLLCYGNLHELRSMMPDKREKATTKGKKRLKKAAHGSFD